MGGATSVEGARADVAGGSLPGALADGARAALELEEPSRFPEAVREAAGSEESWQRLQAFAHLLVAEGEVRGLIGPRELPRLWSRHIVNSMAVNAYIPAGASVADVGTGAGFPGVVVAITRPDVSVTMIDSMERRCEWLEHVVRELDLGNASVVTARAEDLHGGSPHDVVTARAVAALEKLGRWSLPLVAPGGALLALKGGRASEELTVALPGLRKLGAVGAVVHEVASPLDGDVTRVIEVRKGGMGSVSKGRTGSGRRARARARARG